MFPGEAQPVSVGLELQDLMVGVRGVTPATAEDSLLGVEAGQTSSHHEPSIPRQPPSQISHLEEFLLKYMYVLEPRS